MKNTKTNKKEQVAVFPVYRVTSYGKDVEFTPDLKTADYAYKDSQGSVKLWSVDADGSAKLLKQKI